VEKSIFAKIYSGHTGIDPYTTAVSNTYQDIFGEGIFTGKGLYVVETFEKSLKDRIPRQHFIKP
jgi:cyclic beta-1,2-glucan synthetase